MNGTQAHLAVEPQPGCPLHEVATTYRIRRFVPASDSTPAQVLLAVDDPDAVRDDPAVRPVAATDRAVLCRLDADGDADAPGHPADDGDRCLAEGVADLPVRPYSRSWEGDALRLAVAAPDADLVQACVEDLEADGLSVTVEAVGVEPDEPATATVPVDLSVLTERQREAAELAAERGYYEDDGASAAELADELDVSKATLSEHLRAVRAKLGSQIFRPD